MAWKSLDQKVGNKQNHRTELLFDDVSSQGSLGSVCHAAESMATRTSESFCEFLGIVQSYC